MNTVQNFALKGGINLEPLDLLDQKKIQMVNYSLEQMRLHIQIQEIEKKKMAIIEEINKAEGIVDEPKVGEYRLPM
jgi:hypothetical protein